jgi:3',5'-cyclic AMP phosphodiesterase CpdA
VIRRLAHISDLHWGRGWHPGASDALHSLFKSDPPDLILVSGDLSQRAKHRELAAARRYLDGLGPPWIAVPGNHDIPLYPLHRRVFSPYGRYRRHIHADVEPAYTDEHLAVFGLCSAHGWTLSEGRLARGQIARLEQRLKSARPSQFVVLLLHHPLVHADPADRDRSLWGAPSVLRLLARANADLIVSGHYHHQLGVNLQDHYPRLPRPVRQFFSPTTLSVRGRKKDRERPGFHWIEVRDGAYSVIPCAYGDGAFTPLGGWTFPRMR